MLLGGIGIEVGFGVVMGDVIIHIDIGKTITYLKVVIIIGLQIRITFRIGISNLRTGRFNSDLIVGFLVL
jgi:hypothetical protein